MDTIALNCLVFLRKLRFFASWRHTDRQTNGQTNGHHRSVKPQSRYRELELKNVFRNATRRKARTNTVKQTELQKHKEYCTV